MLRCTSNASGKSASGLLTCSGSWSTRPDRQSHLLTLPNDLFILMMPWRLSVALRRPRTLCERHPPPRQRFPSVVRHGGASVFLSLQICLPAKLFAKSLDKGKRARGSTAMKLDDGKFLFTRRSVVRRAPINRADEKRREKQQKLEAGLCQKTAGISCGSPLHATTVPDAER